MGDIRETSDLAADRAAQHRARRLHAVLRLVYLVLPLAATTLPLYAFADLVRELQDTTTIVSANLWALVSGIAGLTAIFLAVMGRRGLIRSRQLEVQASTAEPKSLVPPIAGRDGGAKEVPDVEPGSMRPRRGIVAPAGPAGPAVWTAIVVAVLSGLFSTVQAWVGRGAPPPDCIVYAKGLADLHESLSPDGLVAMVEHLEFTGYEERCGDARAIAVQLGKLNPRTTQQK